MVGNLNHLLSLGISIAICSATAFGLMIVMLVLLPERMAAVLQLWRPRRTEIDRCRMPMRGIDDFLDGPSCVIVPEHCCGDVPRVEETNR